MTKSQTARRHGISNNPPELAINNLRALCEKVLQPTRDYYMQAITVTSGYRSPYLNEKIGGSKRSQHCLGEAADFEILGVSNLSLATWISCSTLPFDQLILEFHDPVEPNSGWVHVSHVDGGPNRGQVLTANRVDGKVIYNGGLPL